jgi:cytochrome c biogenesis protein CcdA
MSPSHCGIALTIACLLMGTSSLLIARNNVWFDFVTPCCMAVMASAVCCVAWKRMDDSLRRCFRILSFMVGFVMIITPIVGFAIFTAHPLDWIMGSVWIAYGLLILLGCWCERNGQDDQQYDRVDI